MPIGFWRTADGEITAALARFGLEGEEFHTAWLLRPYLEQAKISNFAQLSWPDRRREVTKYRNAELLRLSKAGNAKAYSRAKKAFRHTAPYIHLTMNERRQSAIAVADCIARWTDCFLFAECIDKIHFDPARTGKTVDEQAFEQVISRFQQYMARMNTDGSVSQYGILVHDNNQTVAKKHTELMRKFHASGTVWTKIHHIIETPLYVDSSLTRMVQMADLCGYALRRFVENQEKDLFRRVFTRADRYGARAVGVRHFAGLTCRCEICDAHTRGKWPPAH
jgi:hypothetical protein